MSVFNYHLVSKEIDGLFQQASTAKTAAWDAMAHAGKSNEEMAEFRMNDLRLSIQALARQMKELDQKIEFLKNPQA
jgi:hypothetical protein